MNNYKENSQYVKDVCARIKTAYNLANDTQLAAFLDVGSSTLSMQQKRGNLDFAVVLQKCSDHDLNWILLGEDRYGNYTNDKGSTYTEVPHQAQLVIESLNQELQEYKTELEKARHEISVLRDVIETLRPG